MLLEIGRRGDGDWRAKGGEVGGGVEAVGVGGLVVGG